MALQLLVLLIYGRAEPTRLRAELKLVLRCYSQQGEGEPVELKKCDSSGSALEKHYRMLQ